MKEKYSSIGHIPYIFVLLGGQTFNNKFIRKHRDTPRKHMENLFVFLYIVCSIVSQFLSPYILSSCFSLFDFDISRWLMSFNVSNFERLVKVDVLILIPPLNCVFSKKFGFKYMVFSPIDRLQWIVC